MTYFRNILMKQNLIPHVLHPLRLLNDVCNDVCIVLDLFIFGAQCKKRNPVGSIISKSHDNNCEIYGKHFRFFIHVFCCLEFRESPINLG